MEPESVAESAAKADLNDLPDQSHDGLVSTSEEDVDEAQWAYEDGVLCLTLYQETRDMEALELAIQELENSIEATSHDTAERAHRLYCLGLAYRDRCSENGHMEDLEMAMRRFQEAFEAATDDHPNLAEYIQGLGLAYFDRFGRTGAMSDLEIALRRFEEALKAPLETDLDRPAMLDNLGIGYRSKFARTGATADFEMAVQRLCEALQASPIHNLDRAQRLHSLGIVYQDKYQKFRNPTDLEMAIQQFREVVEAYTNENPLRAMWLQSLGEAYFDKYERNKIASDLGLAIRQFREALRATPDNHPDRAARLHSLGSAYIARIETIGSKKDLEAAVQLYEDAVGDSSSSPRDRLRSAIGLVRIFAISREWSEACLAVTTAVSLIPLIAPRFLENTDKQHLLTEINGFASEGASVMLMAGKSPYEAIKVIELARGIIFSASGDLRSDISDLWRSHPNLAAEYDQLRCQLDMPTDVILNQRDHQTAASTFRSDQRYIAGQKVVGIIDSIRKLPGYDRFLLPQSEDEMRIHAASGPIVIVNASFFRCDAFIIVRDDIKIVQLPRLKLREIRDRTKALDSKTVDVHLLEWLWDTIAEPVLQTLGFIEETPPWDNKWPRIWWIPTGPLTRFPIHAAGYHYHSEGTTNSTVLDRAISTYNSSIGSLIRSRRSAAANITTTTETSRKSENNIVLVGMPELPYATHEIIQLKALCNSTNPAKTFHIHEPDSIREDVLAALSNNCSIFHFAGHGRTHLLDPLKSALILSDGELTVSRLSEVNLHNRTTTGLPPLSPPPFLAFLSACGTGQVKSNAHVDESLHLIAACQLAGFRHVVGTLWEVNDQSCVDVALATYRNVIQGDNLTDDSVSKGLHYACRELRGRWVEEHQNAVLRAEAHSSHANNKSSDTRARDVESCDDVPLYWVPYIHFGA